MRSQITVVKVQLIMNHETIALVIITIIIYLQLIVEESRCIYIQVNQSLHQLRRLIILFVIILVSV